MDIRNAAAHHVMSPMYIAAYCRWSPSCAASRMPLDKTQTNHVENGVMLVTVRIGLINIQIGIDMFSIFCELYNLRINWDVLKFKKF